LTAIVTGAGGFIGRWLVEQLVFDGYSVLAIIRPQSLSFPWMGLQTDKSVEIICCDIANYDDLPMLIGRRNGAVFFHLAQLQADRYQLHNHRMVYPQSQVWTEPELHPRRKQSHKDVSLK